ncbi:MAG: DNA primase [Candidatus Paceibacterota bacterium]
MNRNAVEEIKRRLPIEEIIGAYVKLEKAGKSYKAKCPFHNEKSASFFVSPDRGGYYCFGCGAKGDIFTFIEQFEGLDFRGALKVLAEKAGVEIGHSDPQADSERDQLYSVIEEAAKYFEIQIGLSKSALDYVKSRGITEETRKLFRIGFAPEGWRNLSVHLTKKGYSNAIMEKAGLIKKSDTDSGYYDRFRGRIMFPINDSSGRAIAFSGRILKDDGQSAKYLNSPDMPLYDKSLVLYGLDKAKSEIRRIGYAILVEGQMDLVMSHQAGIKNTVAASGTALTDEVMNESGTISNLGLVRRLSPNIIIAFDADQAGRKAAMRAAGIALGMGMDVKIADITGGKDPAELVQDDVEKWKTTLRNAKPLVEFELGNVMSEVTDPRKLPKAINERILPLIVRMESGGDQSFFVQKVSDRTKIPLDVIWQDLKVIEKRQKPPEQNNYRKPTSVRTSSELGKRIDIVERRLFGLIALMEKENLPDAPEYRATLKNISGTTYEERANRVEAIRADLIFEAETFYGAKPDLWKRHADELLINFEEDLVNEDLVRAMQELKNAERDGNKELLEEYAKKCQVLSLRKVQVANKRKK